MVGQGNRVARVGGFSMGEEHRYGVFLGAGGADGLLIRESIFIQRYGRD